MKQKFILMAIALCCALPQLWAQADREMTVQEELTLQGLAANQYNSETKIQYGKKAGKEVGKNAVLIKISLPDSRISFDEKQVFSAEYKSGEWWVYFPVKGVGTLTIRHPQYHPLNYSLKGFKFDQTQVYTMKIGLPAADQNTGKAYVTLTCQTPTRNAIILISDQSGNQTQHTFDSNNRWRDNLPYGSYAYLIQAEGYQDSKGTFVLKDEPVDVPVNLASVVGDLTIVTDRHGREGVITIDGQKISEGTVTFPVGDHLIKATDKSGQFTKEKRINLTDAGATVDMKLGGMLIFTGPSGGSMTINGQSYSVNQAMPEALGTYSGYVSKYGYDSKRFTKTVGVNGKVEVSERLLRTIYPVTFLEYTYSPKAPLGIFVGHCKRFGWCGTLRVSLKSIGKSFKKEDGTDDNKDTYNEVETLPAGVENCFSDLRFAITTGPMVRAAHWLYFSAEVGYGLYGNLFSTENTAGGNDYYYTSILRGFECNLSAHLRFNKFVVSGGYSLLFAKEKLGEFNLGIGINLYSD